MSQHILALNFPDCTNESVFLINDISTYTTLLPTNCSNLQITPPGFATPQFLTVSAGFNLILNAFTIGMTNIPITDTCPNIPDGIYNVRYSVAPSDLVFVEYKILRIVQAINRYYSLKCRVGLSPCLPDKETEYQLQQLDMIYDYLLTAKLTVEELHQFSDGMNLYRYAINLMNKMSFDKPRC